MNLNRYPDLIPAYEHERLEALRPYQVLGTPGQELFNDFVGIVAKLFDMPIALVSLVRADDVVFIGNSGLADLSSKLRASAMMTVFSITPGYRANLAAISAPERRWAEPDAGSQPSISSRLRRARTAESAVASGC